jgi:AraC-type DNA-binding domain-containing proteins
MSKKKRGSFEFRYYELPADFPVLALLGERWIRPYDFGDSLHFHSQVEIGYCYWGQGSMAIEDKLYKFSSGTITFIPKNIPHSTQCENAQLSKWEYLFVDTDEIIKMIYPNTQWYANSFVSQLSSKAFCLNERDYPIIAHLILDTMNEMRKCEHYYKESVKGLLMALFVQINRLIVANEEGITILTEQDNIIVSAMDFIMKNYMKEITIQQLAEACHVSETHFRRVFYATTQMNPSDYVNTIRIRMSCILLRSSSNSIQNIAIKCGFPTITTFNRNFKRIMGTTPLKWRNDTENTEKDLKNYVIMSLPGWL